ncbi:Imm49 family immunity protein [Streptomyces xiamenensis]
MRRGRPRRPRTGGSFHRPAVLLPPLVDGYEGSFSLALAGALEAHRDHHQVGDRADLAGAAFDLPVLAPACHARCRGWDVRVESPFCPSVFRGPPERRGLSPCPPGGEPPGRARRSRRRCPRRTSSRP